MNVSDDILLLPAELRDLVKWSVSLLGKIIQIEEGESLYQLTEQIRSKMAFLKDKNLDRKSDELRDAIERLRRLSSSERERVARAFTLMLELMNACENAYRNFRLAKEAHSMGLTHRPQAIIYVLTAHPTESRTSQNVEVFRWIQKILTASLEKEAPQERLEMHLMHALGLAWKTPIVKERKPQVRNEAEHIYSIVLHPEILGSLLETGSEIAPIYIRSWVGGDKDGHPGVNEKVMLESLRLSRKFLIHFVLLRVSQVRETLSWIKAARLESRLTQLCRRVHQLGEIRGKDGRQIALFRKEILNLSEEYHSVVGVQHPLLQQIRQLLHVFPGLVVPLELRESSDVLMSKPVGTRLAIDRMLSQLRKVATGGDPRWYARGLIVSMASRIEHLGVAEAKIRRGLGGPKLPVIPLFEELPALAQAPQLIGAWIRQLNQRKVIQSQWNGMVEVMVGYSDSAKESGVFPSRLAIAKAMHEIDQVCQKEKIQALFFQGSGGSIDRGGGSIQDQIAWWPKAALDFYKVTIQGEMVERSLASRDIARGQIRRIAENAGRILQRPPMSPHLPILWEFAELISKTYREAIESPTFLDLVEKATIYRSLSELKIGSRPTRRSGRLSVDGLRAIPWVMCWTQTRVLFPTWWGVGTAWRKLDESQKENLKKAFQEEAVFSSFIRALGFTLAKVELPVWRMYLEQSRLEKQESLQNYEAFLREYQDSLECVWYITGREDLLWFKPWLGESVKLRSPMIYPLNLLQILAIQDKDSHLFRLTVTGISNGMMTTG